MAQISTELTVDVTDKNYFPPIVVKQHDKNSRFLTVTLPVHLSDENIRLVCRLPDDTRVSTPCTIIDANTVTTVIAESMMAQSGTVLCEILITEGDIRLSSATFQMIVQEGE